jgi:ABC-2 type transport system permease protein
MNSTQAGFHDPGLWPSVWKLLRLRLVILFSGFRRAKTRVKIGYIALALVILAFLGFVMWISFSLLSFLRSPELSNIIGNVDPFLESIPTMLLTASVVGILVTGFGVLLSALYLSGDMDFLMSAPISIRAVFIAKLVQAILPNFGILCLFTLPILFGLGLSNGYHFLYYPLVLIVLGVLSLAAAALASLLVMIAARFVPARRLAEVLGFVVGTFFFIFSQTARFINFDVNNQQVANFLSLTERFNQPWSPFTWAGEGLVDIGKAAWLPGAGLVAASLVLSSVVFYAALLTSERLYYTGWSSLQNNRRRKKAKSAIQVTPVTMGKTQAPMAGLIPAPIRAIMVKDFLVYRRDLRNLSQLLTPLILGIVYAVSLIRSGGQGLEGQGNAPEWFMNIIRGIMIYADVALALFLGWMLVARLAGLGFSQEGRYYWMLKVAPVSARQLLTAKFLVGYLPTLLLCGVYLIILQILKGAPLGSALISLIALALTLAGLTSIYLAFGAQGAKFDWEHPSRMGSGVGCLGNIVGMLFLPICFGFFIAPPLLTGLVGVPTWAGQVIGLFFGGAISIAAAIIPLRMVEKRVTILNEA